MIRSTFFGKLDAIVLALKESRLLLIEARRRHQSGLVTTTDILDFEVYIGELEENEDEILHDLENNRLQLIPLVGLNITDIDFKESSFP